VHSTPRICVGYSLARGAEADAELKTDAEAIAEFENDDLK